MTTLAAILSPWFVLPLGGALMLCVAAHISATIENAAPPSRRRIRLANGWIMLIAIPLIAAGFGVIDPDAQPRAFVLIWFAAIGFLFISVLLAMVDVVNTLVIARRTRGRVLGAADELKRELERMQRRRDEPEHAGERS
ncbi:MAG: hypothetical protein VYC34_01320 [Planctomycetota bacterium]|nr:hypothetical protein [Planctomycetota bacterium]